MRSIEQIIAEELSCQERQVHAAVALLDDAARTDPTGEVLRP